jgi:hypothetical protein
MADFSDELDDLHNVTLEELDSRIDTMQMDIEDLGEKLKHIERAAAICVILLIFVVALELQLITPLELKQKWQQFWNWLQSFAEVSFQMRGRNFVANHLAA